MDSEIVTAKEFANRFRVTPETVRRWAREKQYSFYKVGRKWVIDEFNVPTFLRKAQKKNDH